MVVFPGSESTPWEKSWPSDEDLLGLPVVGDWRLKEIRYRNEWNVLDLTAIQLVFANGIETPLFEASLYARDKLNTI